MALKKMSTDELIKQFIDDSIFLTNYESTDRIINNQEHNYNLAKKVSGRINNIVKQLLSSEEGTSRFSELLYDENVIISSSAAKILYPIYPKRCIEILKRYSKSLSNKLDSYKIDTQIEGFIKKQKFFFDYFKKIYNTDDLDSLNREKDIWIDIR